MNRWQTYLVRYSSRTLRAREPLGVFHIFLVMAVLTLSPIVIAQNESYEGNSVYSFANPPIGKIDLQFTPQMRNALESGVPLSIELDFIYITPRVLLDNHSLSVSHAFRIERHALSNRYMVKYDNETRPHLFATLIGLTDYLGAESIRLFTKYVEEHDSLVTSDASVAHMRLKLDKYKLPGPVRLSAFVSNQWEFDTGWITWDLEN